MTDLEMKQMVFAEFPFLTDVQYKEIEELIIEIEANMCVDTFIALLNKIFFSATFSMAPTG